MHEHIKDVCRRLAKAGYLAVAPELYARQGDVSKLDRHRGDRRPDRREGARRAGDVRPRRDRGLGREDGSGDAAQARRSPASAGAAASSGSTRRTTRSCKAGVAWYGRLAGDGTRRCSRSIPIDVAAELKAPVLGLYGGEDAGIPLDGRRADARRRSTRRARTSRDRRLSRARRTASTPTTGRAIGEEAAIARAGRGCSTGSRRTESDPEVERGGALGPASARASSDREPAISVRVERREGRTRDRSRVRPQALRSGARSEAQPSEVNRTRTLRAASRP